MPTLQAPALQRLYKDWDDRRRGREFPSRSNFDPCDPTNMVARLGVDLTGKFIDEMADRRHFLLATQHFTEVVETRHPVVENRHGVETDHRIWNCEILVLPLSSTGADIDMLMGCVMWDEIDPLHPPMSRPATVS